MNATRKRMEENYGKPVVKKNKEVTIKHKKTGEEKVFKTVGEASEFLGYSRGHLSGLISGKRKNNTEFLYSTD